MDKSRIFQDTPGKKNKIHFNNAGAALMPTCVLDAQRDHLELEASIGGYEAAAHKEKEIESVYRSIARLLNAERDEIAIVENATVGWSMAFYSIQFQPGDRILTVEAEYASNYLAYLQLSQQKGVQIDVIPSNQQGNVCIESLTRMIDEKVKLISVTHVPTNGGLVNPVAEIGRIARQYNILYLVDACQSVGQMPVDVKEIQCDFLTVTSRKYLRGPRGVGFLYVRKALIEALHPPVIDLRSATWIAADQYELAKDASRFENWEFNYSAVLGLGAAIDYALDIGLENISQEIASLANSLRSRLHSIRGVNLWDIGDHQCGIVSFSLDHISAVSVKEKLKEQGINVSVSNPSSTLLDAQKRQLPHLIRASLHYYNDEHELDTFVEKLDEIAKPQEKR